MKLGTGVDLCPGLIVLDRDPALPSKGHSCPQFSVHVRQTLGWIKAPLRTEVGLCPGDIVLDGDAASPPPNGAQQLLSFRPMSVVAKRSPISATAELLLSCALH